METITINIDEYNLLKEQNKKLRVDSNEYVKVKELYFQANEENDKLKEEMDKLKEENKKLKEQALCNNTHDSCCMCDVCEENEELKQQISDITDAVWDESFPDVRTDLLIQDIHKLRVDSNEYVKVKELYFQAAIENEEEEDFCDEKGCEGLCGSWAQAGKCQECQKVAYYMLSEDQIRDLKREEKNKKIKEEWAGM